MKTIVPLGTIIHDHTNYPPGVPVAVDDALAAELLARGKARVPMSEVADETPSDDVAKTLSDPKPTMKTNGKRRGKEEDEV
jgi:hypothetical protein